MAGATVRRALGVTTKAATEAMVRKVRVQRGLSLEIYGCELMVDVVFFWSPIEKDIRV